MKKFREKRLSYTPSPAAICEDALSLSIVSQYKHINARKLLGSMNFKGKLLKLDPAMVGII